MVVEPFQNLCYNRKCSSFLSKGAFCTVLLSALPIDVTYDNPCLWGVGISLITEKDAFSEGRHERSTVKECSSSVQQQQDEKFPRAFSGSMDQIGTTFSLSLCEWPLSLRVSRLKVQRQLASCVLFCHDYFCCAIDHCCSVVAFTSCSYSYRYQTFFSVCFRNASHSGTLCLGLYAAVEQQ